MSAIQSNQTISSHTDGRRLSTRRPLRLLIGAVAASAALVALSTITASPASAASGRWYSLSGTATVTGSAIIDSRTGSAGSGGTAHGRVQLVLNHGCGYIKYAPFADYAADGGYNKLQRYCGNGTVTLSWSDTFHLAYDGFKFQACSDNACGSERHIYF